MTSLEKTGGFEDFEGFCIRDEFKKFFNYSQGAVPWKPPSSTNTL